MSFLDLDVGISREGGNVSGTSVELVKIKLKKGTRKTRSDRGCLGRDLERSRNIGNQQGSVH